MAAEAISDRLDLVVIQKGVLTHTIVTVPETQRQEPPQHQLHLVSRGQQRNKKVRINTEIVQQLAPPV